MESSTQSTEQFLKQFAAILVCRGHFVFTECACLFWESLSFFLRFIMIAEPFRARTCRQKNVVSTSMRRHHVVSTSIRLHFDVVCLLGFLLEAVVPLLR